MLLLSTLFLRCRLIPHRFQAVTPVSSHLVQTVTYVSSYLILSLVHHSCVVSSHIGPNSSLLCCLISYFSQYSSFLCRFVSYFSLSVTYISPHLLFPVRYFYVVSSRIVPAPSLLSRCVLRNTGLPSVDRIMKLPIIMRKHFVMKIKAIYSNSTFNFPF